MSNSSSTTTCTDVPSETSEQLCYIYCSFCNIVLAVSVPCRSLFETVTVRCGNCTNMWPVNLGMTASFHNTLNGSTSNFQDSSSSSHQVQQGPNHMVPNNSMNLGFASSDCNNNNNNNNNMRPMTAMTLRPPSSHIIPNAQEINHRHLEKRQRVPSLYNRFIKEEIQRIKASNPEISHKEAFSTAAKNWAHFPRIQFGPRMENHHKLNFDENPGSRNPPDGKA